MTCIVEQQIAQHVNEPEAAYCKVDGCVSELTETKVAHDYSLYKCDGCGTVHIKDSYSDFEVTND